MQKSFTFLFLGVLIAVVIGCGGSGSSSSTTGSTATTSTTSTTTTGTTGSTSTFNAQLTIIGGSNVSNQAAGTHDVQVTDGSGNLVTIKSVFVPEAIASTVPSLTVIKAGSLLWGGHYTSQSASYVDANTGQTYAIPLTSSGAVAQDTAVTPGNQIILPIDTIGQYAFPNGISVSFTTLFKVVQIDGLTVAANTTAPSGLQPGVVTGTLTFSGTSSATAGVNADFSGTGQLIIGNSGSNSNSPVSLTGELISSSTSFPTATVLYTYNG